MKNAIKLIIIIITLFALGCTENDRAKRWGGTMTVHIPERQKLVEMTWKQGDLWYSYRPMRAGEFGERYEFVEDSTWGINEGKVIFIEKGVGPVKAGE